MLLYNWESLYNIAGKDCEKTIKLIFCMTGYKQPTRKEYESLDKLSRKDNTSFIVDEVAFITDTTVTNTDKCVYLLLAARRNYSSYNQSGIDYIETYIVSDMFDIKKLKRNKLLNIIDDRIYFKY